MRKTIAAVTAGLLLVAGQAAATANQQAAARVGDRVGARAGASSEMRGGFIIPAVAVIAFVVVVGAVARNDKSKSN